MPWNQMPSLVDEDVRKAAAEALGKIGPDAKAIIPALIKLLRDDDWGIRWTAARALGNIGPNAKTAIPALTEFLEDKDGFIRTAAAEALEKIEKKQGSGRIEVISVEAGRHEIEGIVARQNLMGGKNPLLSHIQMG